MNLQFTELCAITTRPLNYPSIAQASEVGSRMQDYNLLPYSPAFGIISLIVDIVIWARPCGSGYLAVSFGAMREHRFKQS